MAAPALADFPVGADLAAGLRFGLATGETEEVTRGGPGETVSAFIAGGYVSTVRLAQGVYPLEVRETENGEEIATPSTYSYATTPLPAPAPGLAFTLEVVITGDTETRTRQDYIYGQPVTWTYGTCAYEVIPVTTVHYEEGRETARDELHYLPEFGHSYLAGFSDGQSEDVYVYVSVEAMR